MLNTTKKFMSCIAATEASATGVPTTVDEAEGAPRAPLHVPGMHLLEWAAGKVSPFSFTSKRLFLAWQKAQYCFSNTQCGSNGILQGCTGARPLQLPHPP